MPDLGLGAITAVSDLTNTVKTYYDRMLLETLDPETKFYQFAVKKPLPKGEGNAVVKDDSSCAAYKSFLNTLENLVYYNLKWYNGMYGQDNQRQAFRF